MKNVHILARWPAAWRSPSGLLILCCALAFFAPSFLQAQRATMRYTRDWVPQKTSRVVSSARKEGRTLSEGEVVQANRGALVVTSNRRTATVSLGGLAMGSSPLTLKDLEPGYYHVSVAEQGFYPVETGLEITPNTTFHLRVHLEAIKGALSIEGIPPNTRTMLWIDNTSVSLRELFTLSAGRHTVAVRVFGHALYKTTVTIRPGARLHLTPPLTPVPFGLFRFDLSRNVFDPTNVGSTGIIEISFSVTGYGNGSLKIFDPSGKEVYGRNYDFSGFHYRNVWDGSVNKDSPPLPEGDYTVVLEGTGHGDGARSFRKEANVRLSYQMGPYINTAVGPHSGFSLAPLPEFFNRSVTIAGGFSWIGDSESSYLAFPLLPISYNIAEQLNLATLPLLIVGAGGNRGVAFFFGMSGQYVLAAGPRFAGSINMYWNCLFASGDSDAAESIANGLGFSPHLVPASLFGSVGSELGFSASFRARAWLLNFALTPEIALSLLGTTAPRGSLRWSIYTEHRGTSFVLSGKFSLYPTSLGLWRSLSLLGVEVHMPVRTTNTILSVSLSSSMKGKVAVGVGLAGSWDF